MCTCKRREGPRRDPGEAGASPQSRLKNASAPACPRGSRVCPLLVSSSRRASFPFTSSFPDTSLEFREVSSPPSGHTYAISTAFSPSPIINTSHGAMGRDSRRPAPPGRLGGARDEGGDHTSQAGAPGARGQCKGARGATQEPRREVTVAPRNRGSSGPQTPPGSCLGSEGFLS